LNQDQTARAALYAHTQVRGIADIAGSEKERGELKLVAAEA
jgi:hypothetical protein